MEHPAPAPSEAHSHHSNGHSSYRCAFSLRSCSCGCQISRHLHGPPQRRRSHHTSHFAALDHTYDTHPTAHSSHELYDAKAGDTRTEPVELLPASDYDKMESPHRSPPEMSLNSRFIRLRQFFQDVYDLPWVATRILADYIHGGTESSEV